MSDFDNFEDFDPFEDVQDDDILESYDSGESVELSLDEQDRRVEAYQKKTQDYMAMAVKPKTYDKVQRLEAIRWLGESGNHEAIPALIKVYEKDKTPGMKEEAAYALGQFKALEIARDNPEMVDEADARIDNIILHDKLGQRANTSKFIIGEIALALLAIVLLGVGFVLAATVGQDRRDARATNAAATLTAQPTPTADTEDIVQAQLQTFYDNLFNDSLFYQEQLLISGREESIDCDLDQLESPSAYQLTSAWDNNTSFQSVVTSLNEAQSLLDGVRVVYTDACTETRPIPRQESIDLGGDVLAAQNILDSAREDLNAAGVEVTEQAFMTSTPEPTDIPTETSEPTLTPDISEIRIPLIEIERIIEQMTDLQGATSLIVFYWGEVVTNNTLYLSGCNQPQPLIPEDYTLDPEFVGISAQLDSAVSNVNTGLQLTRAAVSDFYAACESGELPEDPRASLDQSNAAQSAMDAATAALDLLQGR